MLDDGLLECVTRQKKIIIPTILLKNMFNVHSLRYVFVQRTCTTVLIR